MKDARPTNRENTPERPLKRQRGDGASSGANNDEYRRLLRERQSSGDRHNQVGSRQENAPLNPKESAYINASLEVIENHGVDKWRKKTIDRYVDPMAQKYITGIIDKLPEDIRKAFYPQRIQDKESAYINASLEVIENHGVDKWREMTIDRYVDPMAQKYVIDIIDKLPEDIRKAFYPQRIQDSVSSQKSGADQLVNPEQKPHDKSLSANLPQILEKRPDVQHGRHDQEASSSGQEDAPLNPKESEFITDIIDNKVPKDKPEAFDTQKTQDVQHGRNDQEASSSGSEDAPLNHKKSAFITDIIDKVSKKDKQEAFNAKKTQDVQHGRNDQEASSSRQDSSSNKQYKPEQGQKDQIEFIPLKQIFIESLESIRDIAYDEAGKIKYSRSSKKTKYKDWEKLGTKIDTILDKNTEEKSYKKDLKELGEIIVNYPQEVQKIYKHTIKPFLGDYLSTAYEK